MMNTSEAGIAAMRADTAAEREAVSWWRWHRAALVTWWREWRATDGPRRLARSAFFTLVCVVLLPGCPRGMSWEPASYPETSGQGIGPAAP